MFKENLDVSLSLEVGSSSFYPYRGHALPV